MRAVAILMLFWAGAALADQNGAFQDGKSLGSSVNQSAFSGINSGAASDKIPGYGTNPSETQFFQGGQGQLSGPGVAKIQNCATATPDPDPIKRQECEAVNFLARNPQIRPQLNITNNDPMILAAKHARNNAESFFQSLGINGGTGSSTLCTTRTETTPAQYTTETCSSFKEVGEQQCTMGRVINIDTDANFQCEQTVKAYQNLTCTRDLVVTSTTEYTCQATGVSTSDKASCDTVCPTQGSYTFFYCPVNGNLWFIYPFSYPTVIQQCHIDATAFIAVYTGKTVDEVRTTLMNGKAIYSPWRGPYHPCDYIPCTGTFTATQGSSCVQTQTIQTAWQDNCAALEARVQ